MPAIPGQIVWHELVTTDGEGAMAFYCGLFGWEIEAWDMGAVKYHMAKVGDTTHAGFVPAPEGAPSHWLAHVSVPDTDASAARATARGGRVIAGPSDVPGVGRYNVIADPAGAVISLYTPSGERPSLEGVFVWDELVAEDAEAAKAFYTDVVGWTTSEMQVPDTPPYTIFGNGSERGAAGMLTKPDGMPGPDAWWVTYIGTDDTDAAVTKAVELGASVAAPAFDVPTIGRIAVLVDPTGAVFGVFQPSMEG